MSTATQSSHALCRLSLLLALLSTGCLDTASKSNDNTQSTAGAQGSTMAGAGAATGGSGTSGGGGASGAMARAGSGGVGPSAGAAAPGGGTGAPVAGGTAEEDAGVEPGGQAGQSGTGTAGESAAGSGAAGETGAAGAPATAPDPSLVMGTGTNCSSYGAPMDGKCGGYFCGVDLATLQKAVDPMGLCGGDLDLLCQNAVVTAVGNCARQKKAQMPNATNDELRPMVEACVFENADIKEKTSPECLACTITAAECAGDMCLLQCLAGDSAQCDACRKSSNCDQPVFSCGGLPSPF